MALLIGLAIIVGLLGLVIPKLAESIGGMITSIPGYMERLQKGQIPESMKRKLYYDRQNYFVRVTKEQYRDLIQGLHDAREQAGRHTVPLSYFIEDIENEEYQSKYNLNYKPEHR